MMNTRRDQIANLYAAGLLLLVVLLALNYMTWRHYDHTIYAVRPLSLLLSSLESSDTKVYEP